jgi:hypothetical protein
MLKGEFLLASIGSMQCLRYMTIESKAVLHRMLQKRIFVKYNGTKHKAQISH